MPTSDIGIMSDFPKQGRDLLAGIVLGEACQRGIDRLLKLASETAADFPGGAADVDIDALGRTLWNTGAPANTAATTMGAMYAAQQLPDPRSRPGKVTGHQLGELTENLVGDYAKGWLVGAALNTIVGTPWPASHYGAGNLALGLIETVVPKLFSP
jgi:hypothetical protein